MKNKPFGVKITIAVLIGAVICLFGITACAEGGDPRNERSERELTEVEDTLTDALPSIEGLVSVGIVQGEGKVQLGVSDDAFADSVRDEVRTIATEKGFLSEDDPFDDLFEIVSVGIPSARTAKKNGWVKNGTNRLYYKNGEKVTRSTTIDGVRYKFSADGVCEGRYTGWTRSSKGCKYWDNGIWDGIVHEKIEKRDQE
ncbi:MAG: hypothetical protein NC084_11370 [Bacteroides sp.]|nr:hypothetical protein [Eubacterium sp.]MCM1419442.1 hypothetical protein [Roseburia sp.]MCM1463290.1 hypothetical protein [Bacteroides sp.]